MCTGLKRYEENRRLKELKKQEEYDNRDKDLDYKCKITGKIFNIIDHSTVFSNHLRKINISFEEYIKKYEFNKIRYCLYCNNEIDFDGVNPIDPYRGCNRRFCCNDHYQEYKRCHPGEIQPFPSKESNDIRSVKMKQKIADGTFTPKNNKWTNWIKYPSLKDNQYRSRWEIVWHLAEPHLEYETIRVSYVDENNKNRTYIVDFFDREKGILYEIKPLSEIDNINNVLKRKFAEKYCEDNGYSYIVITDFDILKAFDRINQELIMEDLWGLKKNLQKQLVKSELNQ